MSKDEGNKFRCVPILSRVVSLYAEKNDLQYAVPGGLIGVGTLIDPSLCRADRLVGQVLGSVGALPPVFSELEIHYFLLRRLLGVKTEGSTKGAKVAKLGKGEVVMVNIGSLSTGCRVQSVKGDMAKVALTQPVCTQVCALRTRAHAARGGGTVCVFASANAREHRCVSAFIRLRPLLVRT